jgi:hypothetical protein
MLMVSGASRTVTLPFNIAAAPASSGGQLPVTGSGVLPAVLWGGLMIAFGSFARVFGRPPRLSGAGGMTESSSKLQGD